MRRKCMATIKIPTKKGETPFEIIEAPAAFHTWAQRQSKGEKERGNTYLETCGIVELADGRIRLVNPEKIRFTDSPFVDPRKNAEAAL